MKLKGERRYMILDGKYSYRKLIMFTMRSNIDKRVRKKRIIK